MSLDHLIFDTTDFETIDDTHSVGAFVRSGESGALITHHTPAEAGSVIFGFADGDVTVGTDSINETAHGLETGEVVRLTTTGVLPAGLALATDYYVIRVDADNIKLAASAKDAERGIAVIITAAAGGGVHTATEQERERRALDVYMVNDISVDLTQADEVTVFQGTSPWVVSATDLDIRDLLHTQDSIRLGDGTAFFTSTSENSDIALDVHISNTEIAVIQGSDSPWSIDDNGGSITVDGVDFDIRDLLHTQDSVRLGDGTAFFTSTTVGADLGLDVYMLNDPSTANTAIATAANPLTAANVAEDVVVSPLANRKTLFVYNNGNKKIYVGESGVSDADGFPISPGSYLELKAGSAVDIEWVSKDIEQEIRTLELS